MSTIDPIISSQILTHVGLSFINTIGLCFFYGGLVRPKNFVSMMGQIFFIYCEVTCVWIFIGFTLVYGDSKSNFLGGVDKFALREIDSNPSALNEKISALLFYYSTNQAACIAPAIWTGATAERVKFSTIAILAPIWSIVIYCPIAHWNQHPEGFLHDLGLDFSSGNPINIAAGTTALAIAFFTDSVVKYQNNKMSNSLKHIQGRIADIKMSHKKHGRQVVEADPDDDQNYSQQSSAFVFLGSSLLWLGGLIGASNNIMALINTNLSCSTATITWVLLEWLTERKYSLVGMCVGTICGLVGISPGGNNVPLYAGACIGIISSLCSFFFYKVAERCPCKFDDRLGVFGCHGICGIAGGISLAFFANTENGSNLDGIYYGGDRILGLVLAGIACAFAWAFVVTLILANILYLLGLYQLIDDKDDDDKDFDEQAVFLPDIDKIIKKYTSRKSIWEAKKSLYVPTNNNINDNAGTIGILPSSEQVQFKKIDDKL